MTEQVSNPQSTNITPNVSVMKRYIRQQLLENRRNLTQTERNIASRKICNHILSFAFIRSANVIMGYSSLTDEVSLNNAMETLLNQDKIIWLPKVVGTYDIVGLPIKSLSDTRVSALGINEPVSQPDSLFRTPNVVLVPGVGFDMQGNRIGFGQGFYDRYLAKLLQAERPPILVGVAFHAQVVRTLPSEPTDIRMNFVVTDQQLYRCDPVRRNH